jgi:hypothetical protein
MGTAACAVILLPALGLLNRNQAAYVFLVVKRLNGLGGL